MLDKNSQQRNLTFGLVKKMNYITNLEKKNFQLRLLKAKEINDKATYKKIKLVWSRPGVL